MPASQMSKVIEHLHKTMRVQEADGQLLESFLSRHEGAAFEILLRRHGPMVWGVCRRLLHNHHDAEDAFQATFLVLVRKANSISPKDMVGNWLYGVAHQTALKARAMAAKRKQREAHSATTPPRATAPDDDLWSDLQAHLDHELSTLPEKYRAVILLCDLDGKTRTEAAQQIGCPEGTVATRLARGRALLAKRMARHGLAVTAGSLTAVLAQNASASVPASVVSSTSHVIAQFAAGQGVSATVAGLADGVLRAMLLSKLRTAALTMALLMTLVGAGTLTSGMLGNDSIPANPAAIQEIKLTGLLQPKNDQPDDRQLLQGDWQIIESEVDGKKDGAINDWRIKVTKDSYEILSLHFGTVSKSVLKLDPSKSPKWIDLTPDYGAFKGQQLAGIYEFKNGEWRICMIRRFERKRDPRDRPKEFRTVPGDGLELFTLKRVDEAVLKWDAEFQKLYGLKDGEVLKRIGPPYSESRTKMFDDKDKVKDSFGFDTDTAYLFYRFQHDRTVLAYSYSQGRLATTKPPPASLAFLLESCLKFPLQQVEVPGNFLTTNVHGEFVLRTGTPPEQWAPVLDKILRTECELPVKLTLKEVERDVVVLGGNFESKPKGQYKNVITFGPAEQKNWGGSGNGNLDDFVVFLNQFTGKHVISEVKAPPKEKLWWFHQDSKIQGDETGRTRFVDAPEPDAIFKTVAEQTGLTVTAAKRKVRVLVVEKSD